MEKYYKEEEKESETNTSTELKTRNHPPRQELTLSLETVM